MANKSKDLLILGALGAAAAAGYFYYDHKKEVPEGCLPQTIKKSVEKEAKEIKKQVEEKMKWSNNIKCV